MTDAALPTGEAITALLDRIGRMTRGLQYAHGLNPAQWESLRFLARANKYSRTPGGLATYLGTTRGTASQTLKALEAKGYIARAGDPRDRRVRHIELTPASAALMARDPLREVGDVAGCLAPHVAQSVADGLDAICRSLEARCCETSFGVCAACGHHQGPAADGGLVCGLMKADLSAEEAARLCVNFTATA